MSDRQRQDILETWEEDSLQALFDEAAQAKADALWKSYQAELEAGTLPDIPEELDAKCRELIRASEKKHRRMQFCKYIGIGLKRAAIVVLVLLVVTSTLVVSVDAIRLPIINLFVSKEKKYSTLFFGNDRAGESDLSVHDKVLSTRRPLGYELESVQERAHGGLCYLFKNSDGSILQVDVRNSEAMLNFDTEDVEQISTNINGLPAVYIQKNGLRIIWHNSDENYIYDVYAEVLSEAEFLEYVYRLAQ